MPLAMANSSHVIWRMGIITITGKRRIACGRVERQGAGVGGKCGWVGGRCMCMCV